MQGESEQATDKFGSLQKPPEIAIRAFQSEEITASWMTWKDSAAGTPARFEQKDGYLLCLQRIDVPPTPHWVDGRSITRPTVHRGQSLLADLNHEHTAVVHSAVDCISLYASRAAFDRFSEEHAAPKIGSLRSAPDIVLDDEVIARLGECLLPAFRNSEAVSQLFIDHVALALLAHLTTRYGERRLGRHPVVRGGLAPWQERRAKEMLLANIGGKIGLDDLANVCGLSRAHFARAFKASTSMSPMQWLLVQRVDRAKSLLLNSTLPVEQIASHCGFADQSHFTRSFAKVMRVTPGAWRRMRQF